METSPTHWLDARGKTTIVATAPIHPPYTSPALTANLVCRVLLAIVANLVCLVPLRLLYRNGEFAVVVFILNVEIKNLETIINSLIWRNDDLLSWWHGYGWCDVDAYIHNASIGLYVTCLLAIMRNLAQQVGLMRASALTAKERRRRNVIQALIIFPFPILQMALTWPLAAQRYLVGTLIGCNWVAHQSWPFLVFFVLPPPIFALITAGYAGKTVIPVNYHAQPCMFEVHGLTNYPLQLPVLIYKRFRDVFKTTETALSTNRIALQRSQRAKRKLYLMVISILIPFFPVVVAIAVFNTVQMNGIKPYNYDLIHNQGSPFPWNTILFLSSSQINWVFMNNCYINIATALPVFIFFGLTKEAINNYRQLALLVGLGVIFPGLREEYDPDKVTPAGGSSSSPSQLQAIVSTPSTVASPTWSDPHSHDAPASIEGILRQQPQADAEYTAERTTTTQPNPFLFRRLYNISVPPFLSRWFRSKQGVSEATELGSVLEPVQSISPLTQSCQPLDSSSLQTAIWAGEEGRCDSSDALRISRKPMADNDVQAQTHLPSVS
ncbi:hypothetical protein QQS21_004944 [Conoideocrella luteorostrata]|uniref:Pheromone receptor n=1 Tax=Conoideocrella luteorostrata TaxID=1105319 RepID=A0AAJ0CQC1_9HYPO|nr:hypothetical protein QQS21_004944 [Conoideocrella luteorostrata]